MPDALIWRRVCDLAAGIPDYNATVGECALVGATIAAREATRHQHHPPG